MPYPSLQHPEPLPLQQSTADPYHLRRHSNTVLSPSLWGLWVLVCTMYVWALWASLAGIGFDSKCNFAPPTVFVWLFLCSWDISSKSPSCPSSVFHLTGASQPLDVGYRLTVTTPEPHNYCSSAVQQPCSNFYDYLQINYLGKMQRERRDRKEKIKGKKNRCEAEVINGPKLQMIPEVER